MGIPVATEQISKIARFSLRLSRSVSMKVVLTTDARKLVPVSIGDPVILIYRTGCGCSGLHMFAEYVSRASLGSSSQMLAFEEVGDAGGIPVFMNDQLWNYLEHIRVHTLTIDIDGGLLVLEATSSS